MSEPPYELAHLDDLDRLPVDDEGLVWRPIRRRFGITAFGTNAYTAAKAGDRVLEEHSESDGHEEMYFVAVGRATFTLGDDTVDAPAGTIVVLRDPATRRHAVAAEPGTTVLAVGGKPGLHEASAWEWSFAAYGHHGEGETERGIAVLREGLEQKPEARSRFLYDLACLESLSGRSEEAIDHLREAVELEHKLLEQARRDSDLDAIREDPRFPK